MSKADTEGDLYEIVLRNDFSSNLCKLLSTQGISNKDLARDAGVTEKVVSSWTNGSSLPSLLNVCRIVEFLHERGVKNPIHKLFPYLIDREITELKQLYEQQAEHLKAVLDQQIDKSRIEKYDSLNNEYSKLVSKLNDLESDYFDLREVVIQIASIIRDNPRVFESEILAYFKTLRKDKAFKELFEEIDN